MSSDDVRIEFGPDRISIEANGLLTEVSGAEDVAAVCRDIREQLMLAMSKRATCITRGAQAKLGDAQ